ncbi:MAG: 1-acyl-sn-glycerol-3-phosphate acyltransferase [Syntrophomonadales bacterium]|jgi:1-acyl-sn-glycerol-3-phosphate acyltransferase
MVMKTISRLYFWITGWKLEGRLSPEIRKCIMVAAPHTSNYDFGYSRAALYLMEVNVRYLAKKELLNSPLGFIFRLTGAIGVERDRSENMVTQMVEMFDQSEDLIIMLAPEGSRKLKGKWKTGFYHAAMQAKVPIVLASLDYQKKVANVGLVFYPTGNYHQDMVQVKEFYKGVTPRYPEKFVLDIC